MGPERPDTENLEELACLKGATYTQMRKRALGGGAQYHIDDGPSERGEGSSGLEHLALGALPWSLPHL